MSGIVTAVQHWSRHQATRIALVGEGIELSYAELWQQVNLLRASLGRYNSNVIGLLMDNHPAWVIIDLAAQAAKIPLVAIPGYFSHEQIEHVIKSTGISLLLTDKPMRIEHFQSQPPTHCKELQALSSVRANFWWCHINSDTKPLNNISHIVYGPKNGNKPRGIFLSQQGIDKVTLSLFQAFKFQRSKTLHLAVLPLSILAETVTGVYASLLTGSCIHLLPLNSIGTNCLTQIDIAKLISIFKNTAATHTVMNAYLLQTLVERLESDPEYLTRLDFIILVGSMVSPHLLSRAMECQLPIFECYSMEECSSVITANTPATRRAGSVGQPLQHVSIKISDEGEIFARGANFLKYTNSDPTTHHFVATGDTGYLDRKGYLYITSHKHSMITTHAGFRIAPEWIERELVMQDCIMQAAIFGEGYPWITAVIVPQSFAERDELNAAIRAINHSLPDYTQIRTWISTQEPFMIKNQQLNPSGLICRDKIWQIYGQRIHGLYEGINVFPRKIVHDTEEGMV